MNIDPPTIGKETFVTTVQKTAPAKEKEPVVRTVQKSYPTINKEPVVTTVQKTVASTNKRTVAALKTVEDTAQKINATTDQISDSTTTQKPVSTDQVMQSDITDKKVQSKSDQLIHINTNQKPQPKSAQSEPYEILDTNTDQKTNDLNALPLTTPDKTILTRKMSLPNLVDLNKPDQQTLPMKHQDQNAKVAPNQVSLKLNPLKHMA